MPEGLRCNEAWWISVFSSGNQHKHILHYSLFYFEDKYLEKQFFVVLHPIFD